MSYQSDPEEPAFVLIRQVKQRDIDYEHLTLVDHLVRDVLNGDVRAQGGAHPAGPDRLVGPHRCRAGR